MLYECNLSHEYVVYPKDWYLILSHLQLPKKQKLMSSLFQNQFKNVISETNICFLTKLTKDFTWIKLGLTAPDLFCNLFSLRGHRKAVQAAHPSLTAKLLISDGAR